MARVEPTSPETAEASVLRGQVEQLFDELKRVDGVRLGPVERMNAIAVITMLRLRAGATLDEASLARLASALAAVLAKTEFQRQAIADAVKRNFGQVLPVDPIVYGSLSDSSSSKKRDNGTHPVAVPWSYRKRLALLALLWVAALGAYIGWLNWDPAPTPSGQGDRDFVQGRQAPTRQEDKTPTGPQPLADRPLTRDEIKATAESILKASTGAQRATLWQLAGPLSRPGDPGRNQMATYKLLQLHAALPSEAPIDLKDSKKLERLLWAYLYIDQPARKAEANDVREMAKSAADAHKPSGPDRAVPLPPSPDAFIAPWWLFWLSIGLPLLAAAVWGAGFSNRKRQHIERVLTNGPGRASTEVAADAINPAPLQGELANLARVARHLHARALVPTHRLDVERTIDATIARGGLFTPHLASLKVTPEYLALITTQGPGDQEADRLSYIMEQIKREDLSLDRRYIEHDANRVFIEREENRITLSALHGDTPDHRLIVLGSGEGFIDPATFEPKPWAEDLTRWHVRALATPVPPDEWGVREARLSGLFDGPLFRSTARGLEQMAIYLRDRADAKASAVGYQASPDKRRSWRFDGSRWMAEAPYREADEWAELWPELQSYVSGSTPSDRRGIDWLLAVAVYPAIRWDLTSYLGLKLLAVDASGKTRSLYDDEIATRLSVLPWFRAGRMPDWLRRRLIAELPPARRREIIQLIGELLVSPRAVERDAVRVRLPIADAGTASGEVAGEAPRKPDDDLAANDRELLNLLEAMPGSDKLLEGKSRTWRNWLGGFGDNFRGQERAWGGVFLAYLAAALWLAPKPWGGAAATGTWWGIALLALGLVTVPLAAWMVRRAAAAVDAAEGEAG